MEQDRNRIPSAKKPTEVDQDNVKVIEWEDFDHELARLWSLSSALEEAKEKKQLLHQKLGPIIQVKSQSIGRLNELEDLREKLEARKLVMGNRSMRCKVASDDVKRKEESLSTKVRELLVGGTALSVARKNLQETNRLLAETSCVHLKDVQRILRMRQRYMVSQISMLYPLKILVGPAQEQELESLPGGSRLGNTSGSKPVNQGSLTILGLNLTMLPFTKMSFFTDKKAVQKSATALGYVAHVVSLVSSYLKVPIRYPLRLGGSRSYINDYAPSVESTPSDLSADTAVSTIVKPAEFPLFLEGQDGTRAAYGVFLLNKDLEQLLNFIGVRSLGPRHVLANLKELIRTIQSPEYMDT